MAAAEQDTLLPFARKTKTSVELPVALHEAILNRANVLNSRGARTTRTELLQTAAFEMLAMQVEDLKKKLDEYRQKRISDLGDSRARPRRLGRRPERRSKRAS